MQEKSESQVHMYIYILNIFTADIFIPAARVRGEES
jgi:hypothetical protein